MDGRRQQDILGYGGGVVLPPQKRGSDGDEVSLREASGVVIMLGT